MSAEENHSGIPTRAIHEAYLDMQGALKAYREAKDQQSDVMMGRAHGELQQAVLTLYELLRPHLRDQQALGGYWNGQAPDYRGDGSPPDPDDGEGILQVQKKNEPVDIDGVDTSELDSLKDWHKWLGYNGKKRIVGVAGMNDKAFVTVHEYQAGLRHLDDWETKYKRVVEDKGGFMAGEQTERVERQRIPIDRLKNAARELGDVCNELSLLSRVEAGGSDIIRNFDQSGDEPRGEFDSVDYNGSPEL